MFAALLLAATLAEAGGPPWSALMDQKAGSTSGAGFCLPLIVSSSGDVASSGAGSQNTTVLDYTPDSSGAFIVSVSVSAVAADASVSVTLTYTDAINTTAQTKLLLDQVALGGNGTASSSYRARANTATHLIVKITLSSQTSTVVSASIMQVS